MTPSITENQVLVAIGDFLSSILPSSVSVVIGQVNRVPPPAGSPEPDYVVLTPFQRGRFATNTDSWNDCSFVASISGTQMVVTENLIGEISLGSILFGTGVADGTTIISGGPVNYVVSVSQTVASEKMAAGHINVSQSTEMIVNAEVHGPNSGDNIQVISTLFRDEYAVDFPSFSDNGISPLYSDDPRQVPFITAADQYEDRWIVPLHLQIVPIVTVSQQFADELEVTPVSVEATFPV